ncbi:hypothetical protein HYALB_00013638 [Hymenoscyphus albidus]|uniref:Uncharacterized protein n=1 Tax=Hymenoscyphus albidus TaxID=595503 RepID=A0A9N9Q9V3_9HELO|nr:hypothetical protein HYALB_00013638 [Hymenoscyphus albidus]
MYHPTTTIDDQVKVFARISAAQRYDTNASFVTEFGYSHTRGLKVIDNELIYLKPPMPRRGKKSSIINMTQLSVQGGIFIPLEVAQ